jgi:hypothetical protein
MCFHRFHWLRGGAMPPQCKCAGGRLDIDPGPLRGDRGDPNMVPQAGIGHHTWHV